MSEKSLKQLWVDAVKVADPNKDVAEEDSTGSDLGDDIVAKLKASSEKNKAKKNKPEVKVEEKPELVEVKSTYTEAQESKEEGNAPKVKPKSIFKKS